MRQAIVVIHGIGDQRPMETIRSFVDAVIEDEPVTTTQDKEGKTAKPKFWNKPDRISGLFELRRFSVRKREFTDTDFYEFYWAHLMKGTQLTHVLSWIWILLWTNPLTIPRRLFRIWILSVLLLVAGAYASYSAYSNFDEILKLLNELFPNFSKILTPYKLSLFIGLLTQLVLIGFNYFMLKYLGDAARYFSVTPAHVEIKQKIREEGVNLLRKLHPSKRYERIVVVGHSLGSVIAYDILKYYWIEVNRKHGKPTTFNQDALAHLEKLVNSKRLALSSLSESRTSIESFQKAQRDLWIEQRKLGYPWLISDLITLGSPLTHASFLFTKSEAELELRQQERELPICPPILEDGGFSFPENYMTKEDIKRTIKVLHHSALFAPTRWTNLYFEGDFIGGLLRKTFGFGIYDIVVRTKKPIGAKFPDSHTKYWEKVALKDYPKWGYLSIRALRNAINLNSRKWLEEVKQ